MQRSGSASLELWSENLKRQVEGQLVLKVKLMDWDGLFWVEYFEEGLNCLYNDERSTFNIHFLRAVLALWCSFVICSRLVFGLELWRNWGSGIMIFYFFQSLEQGRFLSYILYIGIIVSRFCHRKAHKIPHYYKLSQKFNAFVAAGLGAMLGLMCCYDTNLRDIYVLYSTVLQEYMTRIFNTTTWN